MSTGTGDRHALRGERDATWRELLPGQEHAPLTPPWHGASLASRARGDGEWAGWKDDGGGGEPSRARTVKGRVALLQRASEMTCPLPSYAALY